MEGILNDNNSDLDYLGYEAYIEAFNYIIESDNRIIVPPIVFGIHGKWGSGKSTFMNLLSKKISINKKNIIIDINPWEYDDKSDFVLIFFAKLYNQIIEKKLLEKTKGKITDLLTPILRGAKLKLDLETIPNLPKAGIEYDFSKLVESEKQKMLNDVVKDNYLKKEKIKEILNDSSIKDKKIIIFIDDLDRCSVDKVINVIESIKLFLNSPNCIFFMGCDIEYLRSSIAIKYKEYFNENKNYNKNKDDFSKEYLEKIIQIPFNIPALDYDNINVFLKKILNTNTEIQKFKNNISINDREFKPKLQYLTRIFFKYSCSPRKIRRILSIIYLNFIIMKFNKVDSINIDFISFLNVISDLEPEYFKDNFTSIDKSIKELKRLKLLCNYENICLKNENMCVQYFVNDKQMANSNNIYELIKNINKYIYVSQICNENKYTTIISNYENGMNSEDFLALITDSNMNKFFIWFFYSWFSIDIFKLDIQANNIRVCSIKDVELATIKINKIEKIISIKFIKNIIKVKVTDIKSLNGIRDEDIKEQLLLLKNICNLERKKK
ncbi:MULTISPECIES: P-loop NTPase fold protein [Clostridium]|uniref:KAP family P-loop NTPase fold protein n=1 Tax=Clostridium TaxID=1485 RepID=UPI00149498AF|nr:MULTISPECIES: P-loop NTPase fold protein [Clostridium]NOW91077.1 hypothetical protein [Clostridium beijerinckii]